MIYTFDTVDNVNVYPLNQDFVSFNETVIPVVGARDNRYYALLDNNDADKTLHFNELQGRHDGILLQFPFEIIARNIGVGSISDSQISVDPTTEAMFIFCGIQIHVLDYNSINSTHWVVGHRGFSKPHTIEAKNTVNGSSSVDDQGAGTVIQGRADLRIIGHSNRTLTGYWQLPNTAPDNWNLYRSAGNPPSNYPNFGQQVYVGIITYASGLSGIPFVGTADSLEIVSGSINQSLILGFEISGNTITLN